jgi:hypothetical protein
MFCGLTKTELESAAWLVLWMLFSGAVIIFNKWLYSKGGFPYPLALTTMHMVACFVVFGTIRQFAPGSLRTAVMPDADVVIPWPEYFRKFIMISVFYAIALGAGNLAYLYSTVSFIQMLKPVNSVFASIAAFAIGVEVPTFSHTIIVSIIAMGIIIATGTSTEISMLGAGLQLMSSTSEGCRLALMQSITSSNLKLDPVTTVFHFSFASSVLLGLATFVLEWPLKLDNLSTKSILVINAALAVLLNVLVATVIKKTSAVVFALSGVVKDLGTISCSSVIFATVVTPKQLSGYTLSVIGLFMFKAYKDNLLYFKEHGFIEGMRSVARRGKAYR